MLLVMSCGGLSDPLPAYGIIFLYCLSFYFVNWSEYFTHVSVTRVGDFGVTEIQWMTIMLLLYTGLSGSGLGGSELGDIISIFPKNGDGIMAWIGTCRPVMILFWAPLCSIPFNILYTYNITKDKIKSGTYALRKLVPIVCMLGVILNWATIENLWPIKGYIFVGIGVFNSLMICKFIVNGLAGVSIFGLKFFFKRMTIQCFNWSYCCRGYWQAWLGLPRRRVSSCCV